MRTPKWVVVTYVILILAGVLAALPNMFTPQQLAALPSWIPKQQITLGLDLQGGSHILLAIDQQDLIDERLQATRDDIRTLLRDKKIGYTGLSGSGRSVQVRIRDNAELEAAKQALTQLTQPINAGLFGSGVVSELSLDERRAMPSDASRRRSSARLASSAGGTRRSAG